MSVKSLPLATMVLSLACAPPGVSEGDKPGAAPAPDNTTSGPSGKAGSTAPDTRAASTSLDGGASGGDARPAPGAPQPAGAGASGPVRIVTHVKLVSDKVGDVSSLEAWKQSA